MKGKQHTVGIFGATLIFLLVLSGCPDGGGGGKDPGGKDPGGNETKLEKVGDDEVKGKTFYVGSSYKTVFSADGTFETYNFEADYISETWEEVVSAKGSYGYNSETKTITIAFTDEEFDIAPRIFKYEITADGSLLGQEVHTSNGTDEFKGYTYNIPSIFGGGAGTPYAFASTGSIYSFTSAQSVENGTPIYAETRGTYYYDSDQKTVLLCPTLLAGKTMAGYYETCDPDNYIGPPLDADADKKASKTNYDFAGEEFKYNPVAKTLERNYSGLFAGTALY